MSFAAAAACLLGLAGILLLLPLWSAGMVPYGLAALVLVVVTFTILTQGWRHQRQLGADLAKAHQEQARLAALVDAMPDGWFARVGSGAAAADAAPSIATAGLSPLLDLRRIETLDDIEQALAPSDAAALHGSFRHLAEHGEGFQILVRLADGSRFFQVHGRRGIGQAPATETCILHTLWLREVTKSWQEAEQREADLAALRQEGAQLSSLLDLLPIPLWRRDDELTLVWCNRAYAKLLESQPDRVVAKALELPAGGLGGDARGLAARALASQVAQTEERFLIVEGDRHFYRLTEMPLADGLAGFALDRTAERDLRDELARHIAAHGDVLDQLGSAIAIYGPDTRLKFHNRAYEQLWGLDPAWLAEEPLFGEVLEQLRTLRKLTEEADFPRWKQQQIALFTSLIEPLESLSHLPDGRTLRSLSVPHPFGGLMFVSEDVTHTLALESSYNTLMAVQQETLDNLAEGVAVFGSDGRLKLCNPAFMRVWSLKAEMVRGEPHAQQVVESVRALLDRTNSDRWADQRRVLVERMLDRAGDAGVIRRTDGSVVRYAVVPLPDGAVLFSCLDVTDSDRVETALRASNEALEAADRLKAEFIANVSYQLRTPLNAIMGFAEILHNQYFGPLNNRQQEYAKGVLEASRRLLSLVNDILDLATIEAGFMVLDRETVDVGQLMHSVAGLTRDWARKQALDLRVEVPDGTGTLEGDEKRLKQALFNLVSNAIKFTPAGGRIVLSASRRADEMVLSVTDTGIGIAPDDQSRVFDRFERGPAIQGNGAGLGLSLVKSFIELHGGRVEISSADGSGSAIRCHLPLTQPSQEPPADAASQ